MPKHCSFYQCLTKAHQRTKVGFVFLIEETVCTQRHNPAQVGRLAETPDAHLIHLMDRQARCNHTSPTSRHRVQWKLLRLPSIDQPPVGRTRRSWKVRWSSSSSFFLFDRFLRSPLHRLWSSFGYERQNKPSRILHLLTALKTLTAPRKLRRLLWQNRFKQAHG